MTLLVSHLQCNLPRQVTTHLNLDQIKANSYFSWVCFSDVNFIITPVHERQTLYEGARAGQKFAFAKTDPSPSVLPAHVPEK